MTARNQTLVKGAAPGRLGQSTGVGGGRSGTSEACHTPNTSPPPPILWTCIPSERVREGTHRALPLLLLFLALAPPFFTSQGACFHPGPALPGVVSSPSPPILESAAPSPPPAQTPRASPFTMRRPRPGELWPLPQPLWCALPTPEAHHAQAPPTSRPEVRTTKPPPLPPNKETFRTPVPSLGEITAYFKEALGETPNTEDKCVLRFERALDFRWGLSWRRCILRSYASDPRSLSLEWWTNDDFGLSELREFFEAPFFHADETRRFYRWLATPGWHSGPFRDRQLLMGTLILCDIVYVQIAWR